ncbi:MAG: PilZ domain-containing protein [Thermodesulfobacteriota bacterium]|nr:PilZ domain-containing protein [Thermodesulfobacteriota bacterium]
MKTVYVNYANQATIICPKCALTKEIDMTNFKNTQKSLKGKCRCGEVFRFTIEFRKNYRKKVRLAGEYRIKGKEKKGEIIVEDLSMNGIRFVNMGSHQISIDDTLEVKFKLDNQMRSEINKLVKVIWVKDKIVGAEFSEPKSFKSELGFYLRT